MSTPPTSLPFARRRTGALAAVLLAVVLAGCGGGKSTATTGTTAAADGVTTTTSAAGAAPGETAAPGGANTTVKGASPTTAKGGATTTTAKPASTTTLKPTASAADVAQSKGYLLTAADVGSDYKQQSSDGGNGNMNVEKCGKGNPVFAKDNPNDIRGDNFTRGASFADSSAVSSDTTIAASVAQASDAMSIIKTDEFLRCIEQAAKDQAAKSAPPGTTYDVQASRRALTGGDDAVDIHLVISGTSGATKFTFDVDAFTYRKAKFIIAAGVFISGPTNTGEPARISGIMKNKIG